MVLAAFANVANAGGCSSSKSAEATPEQMMEKQGDKKEVDA
ncbi:putative conserved secreted protein [Synechococcus sp. A15-24]|nr:putative conserved secreted protein [Synechococcus sp. A15-24]